MTQIKEIQKLATDNKKEYYKNYYKRNKDKIKENSRKQYQKKKCGYSEIKVEFRTGSFCLSFD